MGKNLLDSAFYNLSDSWFHVLERSKLDDICVTIRANTQAFSGSHLPADFSFAPETHWNAEMEPTRAE